METETVIVRKPFQRISYYLQPALYTLIVFTLLLSVVMISSSVKNRQQTVSSTISQSTNADEQDYLKTIAMNDQTFEEEYINIINK